MPMSKRLQNVDHCERNANCNGTALVSIGNTLRQDDGIGQAVLDNVVKEDKHQFCRFDLGGYSINLIDCLKGHNLAIVIDSTINQGNPGKVTFLDLNEAVRRRQTLQLNSCHGLSLVDELQLAQWRYDLPSKLYFFGVEADSTDWTEGLSSSLESQLPTITEQLTEALNRLNESNTHA